MSIFKWFSAKPIEDPLKNLGMDEDKSFKSRYSSMINHIDKLTKNVTGKFNPRLYDFYKDHGETVANLCLTSIYGDSKPRVRTWEEALDSFTILIQVTRYGHIKRPEDIQNIAKACLQDGNRLELKKIGLTLILNLISHKEMLSIPFQIFQAAIDLSAFSSDSLLQLPDRYILSIKENDKWINIIKEALNKTPPSAYNELTKILKYTQGSDFAKEMLILLKELLEFTFEGGISQNGLNSADHFKKWFGILRKSYLIMLYPDISEESHNKGFKKCPDILHLFVLYWIKKSLKIPEISVFMLSNEFDRIFLLKILEKSFKWLDSSSISCENAIRTYKIFESWLQSRPYSMTSDSIEKFYLSIITHSICVFENISLHVKTRKEFCFRVLNLINIFNGAFPDNPKMFSILTSVCKTLYNQDCGQEIIEFFCIFLLNLLKSVNWAALKIQSDFEYYLHNWSSRFSNIIRHWKTVLLEINEKIGGIDFINFIQFSKLLGDPLDLRQLSQIEWAKALSEIVKNVIIKGASPVIAVRYFIQDLSKLVLNAFEETQQISLNTLCLIFTRGPYDIPSKFLNQHLCYLMSVSAQKPYLSTTILSHCSKILDYQGMHVLINNLLNSAISNKPEGLAMIFRVFSFPNYYKTTLLLSLTRSRTDYLSLKPIIFQYFTESLTTQPLAIFIDGFTVLLTEEIANGYEESIEEGIKLLLTLANHEDNSIAITALQNLSILVPIAPMHHNKIIDFVVTQVMKPHKFENEQLSISIFELTMCILMSLQSKISQGTLKILFQRVSKFGTTVEKGSKLSLYMDHFLSFLSFFYLNFPLKSTNLEIIESSLQIPYDPSAEYFSFNQSTILTLYSDKYIIRNEFGKFLWTCRNFEIFNPETFTDEKQALTSLLESSKILSPPQPPAQTLPDSPTLELLISFIQQNYDSNFTPSQINDCPAIQEQIEFVESLEQHPKRLVSRVKVEKALKSTSKVFWANLGMLNLLEDLENTENRLERSLGLLDSIKPREQVKIGILYVKQGQDDEKDILANDECSVGFKEFLYKIGKVVRVEDYLGNLGGIDAKGSCGEYSVAFSDWETDLMFHVPVLMPTDLNDRQQVSKKRHVGNDMVTIVWTESSKEYRQDTFITHFNFVNIVIYPMQTMLYRVQIQNKFSVEFGPLRDGMVVSWKVLPYLVRKTALNANRALKVFKHLGFERQTMIRLKTLREIIRENSKSVPAQAKKFMTTRF